MALATQELPMYMLFVYTERGFYNCVALYVCPAPAYNHRDGKCGASLLHSNTKTMFLQY